MQLTMLTIPGCPNGPLLEQRLDQALAAARVAGHKVTIRRHVIEDAAQARAHDMHGSPTLLIDGVDPFDQGGEPTMACRLYRAADGSADGAPSVAELRRAIEHAAGPAR